MMDAKSQSGSFNRVYEDFEPDFQWQREETTATLTILLPGFRRDQLKVQITSTRLVKIIGERQISDNKWLRITKQLSIPTECDTNDVTAKFERDRLFIKFSIKPSKPREDEEEAKPRNEVSEPQKKKEEEEEEEEGDGREKTKKNKKVTTGGVVENIPPPPPPPSSGAMTSKKNGENLGLIKRTKTRVLDYTISLKPSLESEELKKPKNWLNFMLLILFVVVLVIYVKQAFRAFLEVISNKF